jgi:hypothetical protein
LKTDIPLKRLTALRGADLLPLLGLPAAALLRVESRELPASATRLDTVLRVRSPQGQNYLHILEWQGYPDRTVLWRLAGYRAWFGQQEPGTAVVGTVVYLRPEADAGDTIAPTIDGQVVQPWGVGRIALWEQDGQAALASGSLGLVVLSPLMRDADVALVETAASLVLTQAPPTQQGDLLSILGVFAEPFVDAKRFTDLVGRERLMSSDLFDYLMKDREAELRSGYEAKLHQQEVRLQEQEAQFREALQQTLEDLVLVRFPSAPLTLARDIRQIHDPAALRRLMVAVQQVPDLAAAATLLHEAAQGEGAPAAG